MLKLLKLDPKSYGEQNDPILWPQQTERLTHIFASKPRAHWEALFEDTDACVTPVLSYNEAPHHPHNKARKTHTEQNGVTHPTPAPRIA